jgi:hypothetical protein
VGTNHFQFLFHQPARGAGGGGGGVNVSMNPFFLNAGLPSSLFYPRARIWIVLESADG